MSVSPCQSLVSRNSASDEVVAEYCKVSVSPCQSLVSRLNNTCDGVVPYSKHRAQVELMMLRQMTLILG